MPREASLLLDADCYTHAMPAPFDRDFANPLGQAEANARRNRRSRPQGRRDVPPHVQSRPIGTVPVGLIT
jgi:hypothetical protein